jgi:E3 ubiquitin-protein ligase BAH
MKFAHELSSALIKEGFPPRWVESAVPYCQLKKCIKNVKSELRSLGFDLATLAQLIPSPDQEEQTTRRSSGVAFQYDFDGVYLKHSLLPSYGIHKLISSLGENEYFHPKLTLFIQLEDGLAVDATLSPDTRNYLENLASKQQSTPIALVDGAQNGSAERMECCQVSIQE